MVGYGAMNQGTELMPVAEWKTMRNKLLATTVLHQQDQIRTCVIVAETLEMRLAGACLSVVLL